MTFVIGRILFVGLSSTAVSVDEGIQGILRLATAVDVEDVTGQYFHNDGNIAQGSQQVRRISLPRLIMSLSLSFVSG